MNPLSYDFSGCVQYFLEAQGAGYKCPSIEITPLEDRVRVQVGLHDLWIDYYAKGWLTCAPDPGFDCTGTMTAGRISFWTEFMFFPGPGAGTVEVVQLDPLQFDMLGFGHFGECADITNFANLIPNVNIDVEGKVRSAIRDALKDMDEEAVLVTALEKALNGVKISGPLSGGLGAQVSGDLNEIALTKEGLQLELDAGIEPAAPTQQRTFAYPAVPVANLPQFGLDPVTGKPYQTAISVALQTLNQLLLARPDVLPQDLRITTFDAGNGPAPITAKMLSTLVPQFGSLPPEDEYELSVRATLPPILVDEAASASGLAEVYLGAVMLSIVPAGSPPGSDPLVMASIDLRGDMALGFHAPTSSLEVELALAADESATTLLRNPLHVDEESFLLLIDSLVQLLLPDLASDAMRFPLPELEGLDLSISSVSTSGGYATAVLGMESFFDQPDLIVERIDEIGAVAVNEPFTVKGLIKNTGSASALGSVPVGVSMSFDPVFMNGDDIGLNQILLNLGTGGLQPGESKTYSITVGPIGGSVGTPRWIFVLADVPQFIGGTGYLCERAETNNHLGQQILATAPDAYVAGLTPPSNLVGGVGPRTYVVRVGRSPVGPPELHIPVGVLVGFGQGSKFAQVWVTLAPGEVRDVDVFVETPASYGSAGQSNPYTVTACTNLQLDANPANNCMDTIVPIAVPWWDLRFSIVTDDPDPEARRCKATSWKVRVTNVGNKHSDQVCAKTGIQLYSGAGNWDFGAGVYPNNIIFFTTPNISPGGTWTFSVPSYLVNCGAFLGKQYIKTEINYSAGCKDQYGAGNYDQESVQIIN
jgi:hypothetical protein